MIERYTNNLIPDEIYDMVLEDNGIHLKHYIEVVFPQKILYQIDDKIKKEEEFNDFSD